MTAVIYDRKVIDNLFMHLDTLIKDAENDDLRNKDVIDAAYYIRDKLKNSGIQL